MNQNKNVSSATTPLIVVTIAVLILAIVAYIIIPNIKNYRSAKEGERLAHAFSQYSAIYIHKNSEPGIAVNPRFSSGYRDGRTIILELSSSMNLFIVNKQNKDSIVTVEVSSEGFGWDHFKSLKEDALVNYSTILLPKTGLYYTGNQETKRFGDFSFEMQKNIKREYDFFLSQRKDLIKTVKLATYMLED